MELLKYYMYIFICINIINGKLRLCPTNVTKTVICTNNKDHEAYRFIQKYLIDFFTNKDNSPYRYRVPRPKPRPISSIVDLNEILAVNEDDKTMTVSLYLIMEWVDPQIDIKVPETKQFQKAMCLIYFFNMYLNILSLQQSWF